MINSHLTCPSSFSYRKVSSMLGLLEGARCPFSYDVPDLNWSKRDVGSNYVGYPSPFEASCDWQIQLSLRDKFSM